MARGEYSFKFLSLVSVAGSEAVGWLQLLVPHVIRTFGTWIMVNVFTFVEYKLTAKHGL